MTMHRADVRNLTRPCFLMYGVFNNNTRKYFPERNNLQFLDNSGWNGHAIFDSIGDARFYIKRNNLYKHARVARVLVVPLETREAIIQDPCENCSQREEVGMHERAYQSLVKKGAKK